MATWLSLNGNRVLPTAFVAIKTANFDGTSLEPTHQDNVPEEDHATFEATLLMTGIGFTRLLFERAAKNDLLPAVRAVDLESLEDFHDSQLYVVLQ